jgi:hypothetical protein
MRILADRHAADRGERDRLPPPELLDHRHGLAPPGGQFDRDRPPGERGLSHNLCNSLKYMILLRNRLAR